MMTVETTKKGIISKVIIITVIVVLFVLVLIFGYMALKDKEYFDITKILNTSKEETLLLNEFVVNLKSETTRNTYLKLQVALMYNDKKEGELIESNVNKIRDIIIKNLLDKTSADIMDGDSIHSLKEELKENINTALNEELVKDVYITDLVIQ